MKDLQNIDFIMLASTQNEDDSSVYGFAKEPIFFRLSYVQPYEDFNELKKLQITERRENIYNRPATLAINISEWTEHFEEEYFTVTLKYLHDMRTKWKYIFVVNSCSRQTAVSMFAEIRFYLNGELSMDDKWTNRSLVVKHLQNTFSYEPKAAAAFEKILHKLPEKYRSDSFVKTVTDELMANSSDNRISFAYFNKYLSDDNSILKLLITETGEEKNNYV